LDYRYIDKEIEITLNEKTYKVLLYIADEEFINENLKPYTWYKNLVIEGCIKNNFPKDYITLLKNVPSKIENNEKRKQKWIELLKEN
jgi:hypothetical protein